MNTLALAQPKSLLRLSDLTLLLVAVVWGTSYGVAKGALAFYPVLGFLAVRFILTFVLLLPALLRAGGQQRRDAIGVVARMPGGGLLGSSALIKTADQLHAQQTQRQVPPPYSEDEVHGMQLA